MDETLKILFQEIQGPLVSDTAHGTKVRQGLLFLLKELKTWMKDARLLHSHEALGELMIFVYNSMIASGKREASSFHSYDAEYILHPIRYCRFNGDLPSDLGNGS
jgi:hypothetical protein